MMMEGCTWVTYVNRLAVVRRRFCCLCLTSPLSAGSEDSTVKLWSLPESGLTAGSMGVDDALADLTFNYTAVRWVAPALITSISEYDFFLFSAFVLQPSG